MNRPASPFTFAFAENQDSFPIELQQDMFKAAPPDEN